MSALSAAVTRGRALRSLLDGITDLKVVDDCLVSGVALDHRRLRQGEAFLACRGLHRHGLEFAGAALRAGAAAIVYESAGAESLIEDVRRAAHTSGAPVVAVPDLGIRASEIAARFYNHPSEKALVIGVTGTNGKTTCSQFLAQTLDGGDRCAVIGTLGYGFYGKLHDTQHTTPDAVSLQAILANLVAQGARRIVMEVSSHALEQGRVNSVAFDAALFTNLTHDHLDYHGELDAYAAAKQRLFSTPGLRYAVLNADDSWGGAMLSTLASGIEVVGYSLGARSGEPLRYEGRALPMVEGEITAHGVDGMTLQVRTSWGDAMIATEHIGRFNASNLLATMATLLVIGVPLPDVVLRLSSVQASPGRMEHFRGGPNQPLAVVDYAHTPDALHQVLTTLRDLGCSRIWCVFGCGGDRDRGKRGQMGALVEQNADVAVVTDDNPRNERPAAIVTDILSGMHDPDKAIVCHDRRTAIHYALEHAGAGDIVLIAGKGHEDYQQIGGHRIAFSDRICVGDWMKSHNQP